MDDISQWNTTAVMREVASLLDVPDYPALSYDERLRFGYPVTVSEAREFIIARREMDDLLMHPEKINI